MINVDTYVASIYNPVSSAIRKLEVLFSSVELFLSFETKTLQFSIYQNRTKRIGLQNVAGIAGWQASVISKGLQRLSATISST